MTAISKLETKTISDLVFNDIIDKISSSEWRSGYKLPSENDLAKAFGVSRNSVRSALQRLVALGIIESRNGEGSFVRAYSADAVMKPLVSVIALNANEIIDLLEFRKGIEIASCELAAQRRTDEEIARLEAIVQKMRTAHGVADFSEYAKYDFQFHLSIAKMSRNVFIENILILMEGPFSSHFEAMSRNFDMDHYMDNHARILDAIKDGDPAAAVENLKRSLEESVRDMRRMIILMRNG